MNEKLFFDPKWPKWGLDEYEYEAWYTSMHSAGRALPGVLKYWFDNSSLEFERWRKIGETDPIIALMWVKAGFLPSETWSDIAMFAKHKVQPRTAAMLRRYWFERRGTDDLSQLDSYLSICGREAGKLLVNVPQWLTYPPSIVAAAANRGIGPREVGPLLEYLESDLSSIIGSRFTSEAFARLAEKTIVAVLRTGLPLTIDNLTSWFGCDEEEILEAIDSGLPAPSVQLLKRGFSPVQVDAFQHLVQGGLDEQAAMNAIHDGFELMMLDLWGDAGLDGAIAYFRHEGPRTTVSISEIYQWCEQGFSLQSFNLDARLGSGDEWRRKNFQVSEARAWCEAGFSATESRLWKDSLFSPHSARMWSDVGIPPHRARAWHERSISPQVAQRRERAGIEP